MLFLPDHDPTYRILSIDPGTDTLGYAILDLNLDTGQVLVPAVETVSGSRLARRYQQTIATYGEKTARLQAHEENLFSLLCWYRPHAVIAESPFLGRFPQAFAALVECLSMIQRAVARYDRTLPLETVDPPTAKKAVGVVGKGTSKDDVRQGVLGMERIVFASGIEAALIDEHGTDAIAVGYYKCRQLLGI